ncbi:uncharacterized protein LOC114955322 [Acropora millepora]|uniref:uncharacterized protein LOC114955322 n=1 Tax=Acropora millepora TaxID=45264 RepID=UPI001CF1C029|nr:uncharacterized protein LOC114955322 [Acropora millepora]
MNEKHRSILRDLRPDIIRDLEPNNILPHLGRVFTEKEEEEIRAQSTRQERCVRLLEILPRKGPLAFAAFVAVLKKEAYHLAVELIEAEKKHVVVRDRRPQTAKPPTRVISNAEKQNIGNLEGVESESVAGDSNTTDLTEIISERDELKKECENLAKHLKEAQLVVSNLEKRLTTTFQGRATSTRDLKGFERTEGKTEHDLCDAREHSEKPRGEIRQLQAEKQDHGKTSQELKELKSLHETFKTETSDQIKELTDRIQQLRGESLF